MTEKGSAWCFAWAEHGHQPSGDAGLGQLRRAAVLLRPYKWNSGDVITVSFLDGDPILQEKVIEIAMSWVGPSMANLFFDFRRDTTETLIRISFQYAGHWSMIGNSCRQIATPNKPTMNLGELQGATLDHLRGVVLHEFGHALGLVHEHQNPAGGIAWNEAAVYRDLSGPPGWWSKETILANMFQRYSEVETNFTATDPQSIMMYPIPAHWTLNGFYVQFNSELSEADKFLIRTVYP